MIAAYIPTLRSVRVLSSWIFSFWQFRLMRGTAPDLTRSPSELDTGSVRISFR